MAKKTTALAKSENKGGIVVAAWMKDLAEKAKKDAAKFQTGVARISFQGGRITIDGATLRENTIKVIIVEAIFGKAYYSKSFKAGSGQTPDCYAFHESEPAEMIPHTACPDKQSDTCATCEHNRFGTAINQDGTPGNGKRCKDEVRIMVMLAGEALNEKSILAAEFRMASVPPSSLKYWGKYIAKLRDMGLTFDAMVTEITSEPEGGAFKLLFNAVGTVTEDQYKALQGKRESAKAEMMQPYPVLNKDEGGKKPTRSDKARSKTK